MCCNGCGAIHIAQRVTPLRVPIAHLSPAPLILRSSAVSYTFELHSALGAPNIPFHSPPGLPVLFLAILKNIRRSGIREAVARRPPQRPAALTLAPDITLAGREVPG
ncbi:hypothetical protein HOY82DRAFT_545417, partial [Tuber indicum]